jgi:hypothetical protein
MFQDRFPNKKLRQGTIIRPPVEQIPGLNMPENQKLRQGTIIRPPVEQIPGSNMPENQKLRQGTIIRPPVEQIPGPTTPEPQGLRGNVQIREPASEMRVTPISDDVYGNPDTTNNTENNSTTPAAPGSTNVNAPANFTPQTYNMPGQPQFNSSVGRFGTYTPGRDWDSVLNEIGSAINSDSEAGHKKSGLQAGYDDTYLKTLAESQIDPLNEAYQEAVKSASGDFNRLGLAGSGFEIGTKYGNTPDSITSRYLQEMGNVHRDVALRGAEAAREDRFNIHNIDEDSRRYWTDEDFRRQAENKQWLQTMLDSGLRSDQQDEANRQWWGNMHNQQFNADDQRMMDRWRDQVDLNQWNLGRYDDASRFNIENQMKTGEINANLKQEAVKNMMNLLGMQSDADWRAIQTGAAATAAGKNQAQTSKDRWDQTYSWLRDTLGGLF